MEPVLSLFKIKKKERKRENENKGKESPFLFTLRSKIARGDTRLTAREDPRIVPFSRSKKKEKEKRDREKEWERKGSLESIEGGIPHHVVGTRT